MPHSYIRAAFLSFLILLSGFVFPTTLLAQENGSVLFKDLEVHHQGINNLNITISYRYKPNVPESRHVNSYVIRMKVDSAFINYPNTTDWWEIVNKNLTAMFMKSFDAIDSLSCEIEVDWVSGAGIDYGHRYPTRCVTARTNRGGLYEFFGFRTLPNYSVTFNNIDRKVHLDVLYQYVNGISDTAYPDGLATENTFKNVIKKQSPKCNSWDELNNMACKELIDKYKPIQGIVSKMDVTGLDGQVEQTLINLKRKP